MVDLTGTCEHCGQTFQRQKRRDDKMLFCSQDCYTAGRLRGGGSKHPGWKGGIAERSAAENAVVRRKVREIARCQRCGSTENLCGHHIEHYAKAPERRTDPSNIEVLCASCHALEHPEIKGLVSRPQLRSGRAIPCAVCGKIRYKQPFELAAAKYCSRACTNKGRHIEPSGKEIACLVCGKLRYVPPVHFSKAKYCSLECSGVSRRADHTRGLPRSGVDIACIVCGKLRYVNQAMVGRAKFCSRACAGITRRSQVQIHGG
jgi:hypothetical protein